MILKFHIQPVKKIIIYLWNLIVKIAGLVCFWNINNKHFDYGFSIKHVIPYFYFRVVQKNLVFVVGLSKKLADTETLKKHEYFGKFGKIHKVVINQSTSYAGAQVFIS